LIIIIIKQYFKNKMTHVPGWRVVFYNYWNNMKSTRKTVQLQVKNFLTFFCLGVLSWKNGVNTFCVHYNIYYNTCIPYTNCWDRIFRVMESMKNLGGKQNNVSYTASKEIAQSVFGLFFIIIYLSVRLYFRFTTRDEPLYSIRFYETKMT